MSGLDDVLELQAMDTALAQLRHRQANLPERTAHDEAEAAAAATRAELDAAADAAGSAAVELASIESMTSDIDSTRDYSRLGFSCRAEFDDTPNRTKCF